MADLDLEQILRWVNAPLFHIGQTAVTLGGIVSALFIVIAALERYYPKVQYSISKSVRR